jgi:hypothetical protein
VRDDYKRALAATAAIIKRKANPLLLPTLLRETPNLKPVASLAREPRQIALRQDQRIRGSKMESYRDVR